MGHTLLSPFHLQGTVWILTPAGETVRVVVLSQHRGLGSGTNRSESEMRCHLA